MTSGGIVGRFCTATPHSNVVFIDDSSDIDARGRIVKIEGASEEDFKATGTGKDNRY